MSDSRFTPTALGAIRLARESAAALGHSYVGSEHLLLGLAGQELSPAAAALRRAGADSAALRAAVAQRVGTGIPARAPRQGLTPNCCLAIQGAAAESRRLGQRAVNSEHLLLGLLGERDSEACRLLAHCGVDGEALYHQVRASLGGEEPAPRPRVREPEPRYAGDTRQLDQCARDLTRMALEGRLDPMIGRQEELDRVIQILSRRTKNNPALHRGAGGGQDGGGRGAGPGHRRRPGPRPPPGPAGVRPGPVRHGGGHQVPGGVRGASCATSSGGAPGGQRDPVHRRAAHHRGGGQRRGCHRRRQHPQARPVPGGAPGHRGHHHGRVPEVYREGRGPGAAVSARHRAGAPREQALDILRGLRGRYEAHHQLTISDRALEAAVDLSVPLSARPVSAGQGHRPDGRGGRPGPARRPTPPPELRQLEERVAQAGRQLAEAVRRQDFEQAALLRNVERDFRQELDRDRRAWEAGLGRPTVEPAHIQAVLSQWTGVPIGDPDEADRKALAGLEETLRRELLGQDRAVEAVARAIRRGRLGLQDPRPAGGVLPACWAPAGWARPSCAAPWPSALFGREEALLRFDMSEYSGGPRRLPAHRLAPRLCGPRGGGPAHRAGAAGALVGGAAGRAGEGHTGTSGPSSSR